MDPIELLDQPGYQRHHRLCNWTDVNASDIKIFLAHVIVMGLVRKLTISKYWRCNSFGSTPFFGIHLTRPQFERILVNLHINDNTRANTDPLYKIRPVVDMVDRNFLHVYTPKKIYQWMRQCVHSKRDWVSKCTTQESQPGSTFGFTKLVKPNLDIVWG